MALKKVNVGHTFFLEAPNDTRSTYDFDPMAHLPENTETIEKLVFNVRVSTDPSNPEYYPQFYFNPDGNAGGNYEYPKNHPDNDGYITGDFLYWPTNDDDSWGVAYAPGLTSDQGVWTHQVFAPAACVDRPLHAAGRTGERHEGSMFRYLARCGHPSRCS